MKYIACVAIFLPRILKKNYITYKARLILPMTKRTKYSCCIVLFSTGGGLMNEFCMCSA